MYLLLLCELAFLEKKYRFGEWQKLELIIIQSNSTSIFKKNNETHNAGNKKQNSLSYSTPSNHFPWALL